MGFLRSLYIKDEAVWDEIKAEAKRLDRSISWYLIACHRRVFESQQEESSMPEKQVESDNGR